MLFRNSLILIAALLFAGCSSTPEEVGPAAEDNQVIKNGFTISVADKSQWAVIKDSPYKVVLRKSGDNEGERYTIQALVVKLPGFDNDNAFMEYVVDRTKASLNDARVKVLDQFAQFVGNETMPCVQFNNKEEVTTDTGVVYFDTVSFTCRHPLKDNAGVYLAYTLKHNEEDAGKDINDQALSLFSSLELTEF